MATYRDWLSLTPHLLFCYDDSLGLKSPKFRDLSLDYPLSNAWLVREGWAEVRYGGQSWRALAGQWLVPRPVPRAQRFSPGAVILSVGFEARWPDGSAWLDEGLTTVLQADAHPQLERRAMPMARLTHRIAPAAWDVRGYAMDYGDYLRLESALALWLAALADALASVGIQPSRRDAMDARVLQAVRLLDSLPLSAPFDLEAIAGRVGLSAVHLERLFREHLRQTPKAAYTRRRFEHACRRLQQPGEHIKAVAMELGFERLPHFSRWFRTLAQRSPREFQRQHGR